MWKKERLPMKIQSSVSSAIKDTYWTKKEMFSIVIQLEFKSVKMREFLNKLQKIINLRLLERAV